jgi:hypothetical protein
MYRHSENDSILIKAHKTEIRDSKRFVLMKHFVLIIEFLFWKKDILFCMKRVQNRRNIFSSIHSSIPKKLYCKYICGGCIVFPFSPVTIFYLGFFLSQQLQLQFNSVAAGTFQISKIQICAPAYSGYLKANFSIMTKLEMAK